MSSLRRPSFAATPLRRPSGPRCHGGASSLLRLGLGAQSQRAMAARSSGWLELKQSDGAAVEHIVGWHDRADRATHLAS
jgi:hypothetical protein